MTALRIRMSVAGSALAAALLLACSSESSAPDVPPTIPEATYSCGFLTAPPPSKLILHTDGGVPGQYMVLLMDSVPDVNAAASALTARYGGQLLSVWTALRGFALRVDDAQAPALAAEPSVCLVEQDMWVHILGLPGGVAGG
jgi:hypothetical protein